MSNLVIVALPAESDYTWKITSEPKPHMTLLFLGDAAKVQNLSKIVEFVQHAASTTLNRFEMSVNRRGPLGPDSADVLFFDNYNRYGMKLISDFRAQLLQESNIRAAYDSVTQYEAWTPHLTLGYPAKPAKKDERDYPGINWVDFDRIAIWDKDFDGLEIPIPWDREMDVLAMTNPVEAFLQHHGIKGMRWGVRRGRNASSKPMPSEDHKKAAEIKGKLKAGGKESLSNQELQALSTRLNLERNLSSLDSGGASGKGKKLAKEILGSVAKEQVKKLATGVATKQVAKLLV